MSKDNNIQRYQVVLHGQSGQRTHYPDYHGKYYLVDQVDKAIKEEKTYSSGLEGIIKEQTKEIKEIKQLYRELFAKYQAELTQ